MCNFYFRVPRRSKSGWRKQDSVFKRSGLFGNKFFTIIEILSRNTEEENANVISKKLGQNWIDIASEMFEMTNGVKCCINQNVENSDVAFKECKESIICKNKQ